MKDNLPNKLQELDNRKIEKADRSAAGDIVKKSSSAIGDKVIVTGAELLRMEVSEMPYLLAPIIPQTGVVALAGSSDTGKSSFLRQFARAIVKGDETFLGFTINARRNNVIYISTEDDKFAMAYLLQKQTGKGNDPDELEGLRYIFECDNLHKKLDVALCKQPVDCIIIDTFTDLYGGDLNSSNQVRTYINSLSDLAKKHDCLIIFLHHIGKRADQKAPSKDNLLGSQGFEAKMRLVLELRKDPTDPNRRHLCILKGNYIPSVEKEKSYVLHFDENMLFTMVGEGVPLHVLGQKRPRPDIEEAERRVMKYDEDGLSSRDIAKRVTSEGYPIGKTKVNELLRGRPSVRIPKKKVDTDSSKPY